MSDESWETVSGILISICSDADPDTALLNKLIDFAQEGRNPNQNISGFSTLLTA